MILVNFTWSPTAGPLTYASAGNAYPYIHQADAVTRATDARYASFATPINTLITFVATASSPGAVITEYKWDLGDGTIGYGATIGHTYKVATLQTAATLIVTDSQGNRANRSLPLNLRVTSAVLVADGIIVVS